MYRRLFKHLHTSALEPRYSSTNVLLIGGSAGAFLVWFAVIFTFWYYGAAQDRLDNPDPIRFPVANKLVAIPDDSSAVPDWALKPEAPGSLTRPTEQIPAWLNSFAEGIARGKSASKPVLVYFTGNNCRSCREMEKRTLSTLEIRKRLSRDWICVRVNVDELPSVMVLDGKRMSRLGFIKHFGVKGIPASMFLDRKGAPVQKVSGFYSADVYGDLLDYMRDGAYMGSITFADFQKSRVSSR